MPKRFKYSFTRFYGELKDRFTSDLYAENLRDALLLIVADFNDIYAQTEEEAIKEAEAWLNTELGIGWTTENCFKTPPELWTGDISYRIDRLNEVSELK
jgi:hypothetical protein